MADPLAPDDISRRSFGTSRRGYEQQEVRGFLHEVSALVDRLTRSETELRQRAERAEARLGAVEQPDEATLLELLGAETTRVLTSAHEAAVEVRAKAEAAAEKLLADATAQAEEIRSKASAEVEAAVAAAKAESESMLEAARTALERQTAEAESAAAGIRAAAEEAARLLREEAERAAQSAREEAKTLVTHAGDEAATVVEAAREQGREMVAEASAVRERVLRDLTARRKRARQQVEKLNAGRERLLQAYELVRRTTDEATNELTVSIIDARVAANAAARRIEDEAEATPEQLNAEAAAAGLIDLPVMELDDDDTDDHADDAGPSPLSGEVPVVGASVTEAPLSETPTSEVALSETPTSETPAEALAVESAGADDAEEGRTVSLEDRRSRKGRRKKDFDGVLTGELQVVTPPDPHEGVRILDAPPVEDNTAGETEAQEPAAEAVVAEPMVAEPATPETEPVEPVAAEPNGGVEPESEPETSRVAEEPAVEPAPDPVAADDVFARLRAETQTGTGTGTEAAEVSEGQKSITAEEVVGAPNGTKEIDASAETSAEGGPFALRAELVEPIEKELARALKRALADEQNEVLDTLRRSKPKGVDDLLPAVALHAARWAGAAVESLQDAASAGTGADPRVAVAVDDLAEELALGLVGPLRERIDRGFAASDGNLDDVGDRVRALYREWRGQRLADASGHYTTAAYARGAFEAIELGAKVTWRIDPSAGACPDCDDNVLAGAITKGDPFPTGNTCAPAHPGCHCLVVVAPD